jgi:hypothetical protein
MGDKNILNQKLFDTQPATVYNLNKFKDETIQNELAGSIRPACRVFDTPPLKL